MSEITSTQAAVLAEMGFTKLLEPRVIEAYEFATYRNHAYFDRRPQGKPFGAEAILNDGQVWTRRQSLDVEEEAALRETGLSTLEGVEPTPPPRFEARSTD